MNDEIIKYLQQIITIYGASVCEDSAKLKGLLYDYCSQYKKEINLILLSVGLNIPNKIIEESSEEISVLTKNKLTNLLIDSYATEKNVAEWVVCVWIRCLNKQCKSVELAVVKKQQQSSNEKFAEQGSKCAIKAVESLNTNANKQNLGYDIDGFDHKGNNKIKKYTKACENADLIIFEKFITDNGKVVLEVIIRKKEISLGSYLLIGDNIQCFATRVLNLDFQVSRIKVNSDNSIYIINRGQPKCREILDSASTGDQVCIMVEGNKGDFDFIRDDELIAAKFITIDEYNKYIF